MDIAAKADTSTTFGTEPACGPFRPRKYRIYTNNMAGVGYSGYTEPLKNVLVEYFDKTAFPEILKHIYNAMGRYDLTRQSNPDRKSRQGQLHDRHELIECLKELRNRLDYNFYIPPPLLKGAKSAYHPCRDPAIGYKIREDPTLIERMRENPEWFADPVIGKPTLIDELRDLMLRLNHLQRLLQEIPIPPKKGETPGKPERKRLIEDLTAIFDKFTTDGDATESQRDGDKKEFIQSVLNTFHIKAPRL